VIFKLFLAVEILPIKIVTDSARYDSVSVIWSGHEMAELHSKKQ